MRIRKRSQSVAPPVTTPQPLPMSYKYQTSTRSAPREGRRVEAMSRTNLAAECSNMQENRCLDEAEDQEAPASHSDVNLEPLAMFQPTRCMWALEQVSENRRRLSDAHDVKDEESGPLEDAAISDKGHKEKSSAPKRRKIEHDASVNLLEGPSSMTPAELLAVTELANGVRQRLAASELSTSEQEKPQESASKVALENSKDALISSIFFVFDAHGDHGLSASEVVKYMIDQRLPGLKEGGARHTVQVANVLRSSSSFFSLGDKKYLLCATVDNARTSTATEPAKSRPTGHTRNNNNNKKVAVDDSSENELAKPVISRRRLASSKSTSRTGKKVQAEKPKDVTTPEPHGEVAVTASSEPAAAAASTVRVARRRGPSSSQKGKGPTQCKRYDGRGWQCSRLTEPGYSLCVHHQDLINKRAAKLKEQQTLSRLMESVQRKAKSQASSTPPTPPPAPPTPGDLSPPNAAGAAAAAAAPVQKRKMLSLLAINK